MNNLRKRERKEEGVKHGSSFRSSNGTMIRKIALVSLVSLLCSTVSFGQFQMGVVAGVNASTQSGIGNIWDNDGVRCRLNAGLVSRYQVNDWLAFKSGIIYSQKGSTIEVERNASAVDQIDKLNYLQIPLQAEFSAPFGKRDHRFFGNVGPYVAFLLDAKRDLDGLKYKMNDQFNDTDFGLSLGFGVEVPFGESSMQVSLNYDMGLSEVADFDGDIRNKSLSLNLAWFF